MLEEEIQRSYRVIVSPFWETNVNKWGGWHLILLREAQINQSSSSSGELQKVELCISSSKINFVKQLTVHT